MGIKNTLETLLRDGFILVFNQNKLDVVKTAEALMEAGIDNMEVTCRIENPLEKIERLRKELPDFMVGAASLVDFEDMLGVYNKAHPDDPLPTVHQAADAGANYLVSAANFSKATYEKFAGKLPMMPGCGTVTEILSQFSLGANLVKVFPAQQLGGPGFVKAFDPAVHKTICIVPTGGTNANNIPEYIAAGVLVLGGSFSIMEKATLQKVIDEQDYKLLSREFAKAKKLIDEVRRQQWHGIDFAKTSLEQISEVTGRCFNI